MSGKRCACCGRPIISGAEKSLEGKAFCAPCYKKVIEERQRGEFELEELLNYLKKLFGLQEIPFEWIAQIKQYIKEGKTYFGIKATLYYYYEIEGNLANPTYGLYVVKYQYEAAAVYFKQRKELGEINAAIDISKPVIRTIVLTPPENKTRLPKYKIEDL